MEFAAATVVERSAAAPRRIGNCIAKQKTRKRCFGQKNSRCRCSYSILLGCITEYRMATRTCRSRCRVGGVRIGVTLMGRSRPMKEGIPTHIGL